MSPRKKALAKRVQPKRVQPGRSHSDGLSYFKRYQKEGEHSASVETFFAHQNADGNVWALGNSKAAPTRESLIQTRVGMLNEIHFADGSVLAFRESEEYATQQIDVLAGIWPPKRILCCATAGQLATLEAKFGPLPDHYYDHDPLPMAA